MRTSIEISPTSTNKRGNESPNVTLASDRSVSVSYVDETIRTTPTPKSSTCSSATTESSSSSSASGLNTSNFKSVTAKTRSKTVELLVGSPRSNTVTGLLFTKSIKASSKTRADDKVSDMNSDTFRGSTAYPSSGGCVRGSTSGSIANVATFVPFTSAIIARPGIVPSNTELLTHPSSTISSARSCGSPCLVDKRSKRNMAFGSSSLATSAALELQRMGR
mmetsp:Transcript_15435/g.48199  ORF Transcript_15435/g.48199 Transcript_15435/m.48199 type:complete len:220 (-) Transcript_15435:1139-1798(-)